MPINKYVSRKVAANYYGCSTSTVRRMWYRGEIDRQKSLNGGYVYELLGSNKPLGGFVYELLDTSCGVLQVGKIKARDIRVGEIDLSGIGFGEIDLSGITAKQRAKMNGVNAGPDREVAKLLTWSTIASLIITWGLL